MDILERASANTALEAFGTSAFPALSADGIDSTAIVDRWLVDRWSNAVIARRIDEFYNLDEQIVDGVDPAPKVPPVNIRATSTIIEIFEGVVDQVSGDEMYVTLRAKMNRAAADHAMSIELANVQPQDRELVGPGAVFYLTMYRDTTGKTVRNVEEVRFRRKPDWNARMIRKVDELAAALNFGPVEFNR